VIVYFSDFDLIGSGYQGIGVHLCEGLVERGYEVLVMGMGYKGEPHDYSFTLCPSRWGQIPVTFKSLPTANDVNIEAWITAFDIPLQLGLLNKVIDRSGIPWIGIFPIESDPLCESWAMRLLGFDRRLIISEFGVGEATKVGLDAVHLPIGIDHDKWKAPDQSERELIRKAMGFDEKFVVLTVADNQERKNLSRSMEVFADLTKTHDAVYLLVTRQGSPVGWVLTDYAEYLGITEKFFIWERGIPQTPDLRDLFVAADAFLLASKAEGLGMPVLEAMAMKVPVVATKCTALADHLEDRRGFLVEPDYVIVDPWGNSHRYMMNRSKGTEALRKIADAPREKVEQMVSRAHRHVEGRTWDKAVGVLAGVLEECCPGGDVQ
jgi:glycosyltransferase involved in cell wall biosynthesis